MKRIILAIAILTLVLPEERRADAQVGVSIDFFYNNLTGGGSWIDAGYYGYCWQPSVAVENPRWRPYSDGYWAYTDVGWTWVSYEDFGWATYHYGRWARLRDYGWIWVPGNEWGPAWVSWRTGGDYVGWAPLPPRYGGGGELVYEGRPISSSVDIDFDIGPAYYNFVDVRYIGEPVLRERIFEPSQNITYINNTVNVTNITYNNSTVYNYGPDYNRLSAYSTRPIRRMTLERPANVDYAVAAQSGGLTKVQGDKLIVAAPAVIQRTAPQQRVAPPKTVKTRIAKPEVETGWAGISDPKAKAELQQKFKKENPKSVPPPNVQPTNPTLLTAESDATSKPSPGANVSSNAAAAVASPSAAASPEDRGAGKGKRGAPNQSRRPVAPVAARALQPSETAAPADSSTGKGRDNNNRGASERPLTQPTASPDATAARDALPNENKRGKAKERRAGNAQLNEPATAPRSEAATPEASGAPVAPSSDLRGRGKRNNQPAPTVSPATNPPGPDANDGAMNANRPERGFTARPTDDNSGPKAANRAVRRNENVENGPAVAPVQPPAQRSSRNLASRRQPVPAQETASRPAPGAAEQGRGKPDQANKNKKGEETPTPSPAQ